MVQERQLVLFFQQFDNDLLTTSGRAECWRWRLLHFQTAGYWGANRSQRWQIYNLWRQSVSHIIRQLNHKPVLASAVIIPVRENSVCQRQGKREGQGESWASCSAPWLPVLAKGMVLQREWRVLIGVFCFIHWRFSCTVVVVCSMPQTQFANFVKIKTLSKNTHLNGSKDGILPYLKKKKKKDILFNWDFIF